MDNARTRLAIPLGVALVLALAISVPVNAQSPEPAEGKPTKVAMMDRCQEMKDQKQKLKEDMKAQDARLTEEIAGMNRAPADRKTDLMAAVITHMVEQRIALDARKAKMEEAMMQHMQMGKESMSQCPMMKGMKDMGKSPGSAGKEQN